jgi:excisionase family DNA binding protein
MENDELVTPHELSRFAKIGRTKIYELVRTNEIPHVRIGVVRAGKQPRIRFVKADVIAWLKGGCQRKGRGSK